MRFVDVGPEADAGVVDSVVGTEVGKQVFHDMQDFLDMTNKVLVSPDHQSPRDQNFVGVGGSDGHQLAAADQAARPTGPTAQVMAPAAPDHKSKRQPQPASNTSSIDNNDDNDNDDDDDDSRNMHIGSVGPGCSQGAQGACNARNNFQHFEEVAFYVR